MAWDVVGCGGNKVTKVVFEEGVNRVNSGVNCKP